MNNLFKKYLPALCMVLLLMFSVGIYGAESEDIELANYLYEMGMLKGTGQGYALNEELTRAQSAVMIVRLLGREEEAVSKGYSHPFLDVPGWANPYVGYLYRYGISKGLSQEIYGADQPMNATQYMAFLIRVLGYEDSKGDFKWNESLKKSFSLGILDLKEYESYQKGTVFLRGDLVRFSYNVLEADLKNGKGISLLRKLMDEGVLPQDAMLKYRYAPYQVAKAVYRPKNQEELKDAFMTSIINFQEKAFIDLRAGNLSTQNVRGVLEEALLDLRRIPGFFSNVDTWEYTINSDILEINYTFDLSKRQHIQAEAVAKKFVTKQIKPEMSDYERELILHDFIVDTTTYLLDASEPYNMYGVFVEREAVCQGYAEAFHYLSTLAGLECEIVTGIGRSEGTPIDHAWNLIEIEGDWYQIDVTWNDPVMTDGNAGKTYQYFNLTDEEMELDHTADSNLTRSATGKKYNYYTYNNYTVGKKADLKRSIEAGMKDRKEQMTFKVLDEAIREQDLVTILENIQGYRSCSYNGNFLKGIVEITNIVY